MQCIAAICHHYKQRKYNILERWNFIPSSEKIEYIAGKLNVRMDWDILFYWFPLMDNRLHLRDISGSTSLNSKI